MNDKTEYYWHPPGPPPREEPVEEKPPPPPDWNTWNVLCIFFWAVVILVIAGWIYAIGLHIISFFL